MGRVDFEAVEKTWEGETGKFLHHIGLLRDVIELDQKVRYELVEAVVVEGGFRQLYHRPRVDGEKGEVGPQIDAVLELF